MTREKLASAAARVHRSRARQDTATPSGPAAL